MKGVENELEEARKKRVEEAQRALEARKIEEQMKAALRVALSEKAYGRMMNVRIANPELYAAAARQAISAYGRVRRQIEEKELIALLKAIKGRGRETKITFK
ncbi:MAG: DNA-binding protein [Candidatus Bilamarchaeaceae archaeon]